MSVTIDDVAKRAGVSTATVSRYLNNSPLIAAKSAEKVRRSMEELNYQPNFVARSLASHSTSTIAFVIDSNNTETYGNDYFLRIQYGIEAALGKRGYYLLIINVTNNRTGENNLRKLALEKRVEGIILPSALAKKGLITMLREIGLPFVVIGKHEAHDINWIDLDNEMGGQLATEHLINSGSHRISFLSNSFKKSFAKERFQGYQKALSAAGIPYTEKRISLGCQSAADGEDAIEHILHEAPDTDGIVCTDNLVAFGALRALNNHGVTVPGQMQLITFDNTFLSELTVPQMSVVEIDVFQLGRQAANILLSAIEQGAGSAQNSLLQVSLIRRGSTRVR